MMSAAILFLGFWMILSPSAISWPAVASWNSWIVAAIGAYCATRLAREHKTWQAALTFIACACIFIAGFIPRLQTGDQFIGRSLIFGMLLFVAGVSSFGKHHEPEHTMPRIYW
jgi:predicted membrane channel-forming protein YqfA (hemolysin III family)